ETREKLEARLSGLRQSQSETRLEIDRTENSIQYHQQQIEATRKSLKVNASEQKVIAQSLQKVQHELTNFLSERTSLAEEEKQIEEAIQKQTELVNRHEREMEAAEGRGQKLQNRSVQLAAEIASLNNLKGQLEQRLKDSHSTRERLEKERAHHSLQLEESTVSLKKAQQTLEKKRTEMSQLREQSREQEEQKQDLERQSEETKEELSEVHKQLIAQRERLHSLQEIELSHAQHSEGVQKLLKHLNTSQRVRTDGTLADFIETNPRYERLVEEFLDEELEYILVDSLQEAVVGISELKTLKSGKCTFLTLFSANGFDKDNGHKQDPGLSSQPGVFGRLSDLLEMKPEVKKAFHRALPDRAQAVVVPDLERAFQLSSTYPENTFITLEGESLTPRGLLSASTSPAKKLGLLSLKRQKRELGQRVIQLQKRLSTLQEKEKKQQEELSKVSKFFADGVETLLQLEKETIGLSHQVEEWGREEARQRRGLKVIEEELSQLTLEQKQLTEKVRELEDAWSQKKASQTSDEKMLSETQKSLQQLRVEFGRIREQLHLVSSHQKVLGERHSALVNTLERIEEQKAGLEMREKAIQTTQVQNEQRLEKMTEVLVTLEADLKDYCKAEEHLASSLLQREQEYAKWKENYPQTEKLLGQLRAQMAELQEKRAQVDVERARAETQLHNTSQQCAEQLQMSLDEAASGVDLKEISEEEVLQEYGELKERLEKFGPLNMAALQEYQESEERHNFLCTQRQDIEGSIADTTRAIQEINRRSREKFRQAFEAINRHFNDLFQRLFGGGEGGMRLLDEDDLLESGIDIYAQPPGKKLQNVRLLSGGEEALTVFALLMGIFTYRPSRFCVLDEVDAPLDDPNVARFTSLIKQMNPQIQFIVITHNKHTMKASDTIYGVTM
ncbi:hypothetical protein MYX82_13900, partial [Acidobacteria bacterium AH-259-D05]|nr:hypothetical protein [Acidobacteria bacterium AH-259-D05]